jgi:hypothetical protein
MHSESLDTHFRRKWNGSSTPEVDQIGWSRLPLSSTRIVAGFSEAASTASLLFLASGMLVKPFGPALLPAAEAC